MALDWLAATQAATAVGQLATAVALVWLTRKLYAVERDLAESSRALAAVASEERERKQAEFEIIRVEPTDHMGDDAWFWVDVVNKGWMDGAIKNCTLKLKYEGGGGVNYVPRIYDGTVGPKDIRARRARPLTDLSIKSGDRRSFFVYWGKATRLLPTKGDKPVVIRTSSITVEPVIGVAGGYGIDHFFSMSRQLKPGETMEPLGQTVEARIAAEPTFRELRTKESW